MMEIRQSHQQLNISKIVFWTDSETVLKWLRCDQRRYVQFVAFRVAEIVEHAPANLWRWVPTALNLADDATRAKTPATFDPNSRWLHGPSWLRSDETNWQTHQPSYDPAQVTKEELRPKFMGVVSKWGAVDIRRFLKFMRLVRCMAWVCRFSTNVCTMPENRRRGELTASEVDRAIVAVCRIIQGEAYAAEIELLRNGLTVPTSSKIFMLKPYLDDDGVLRLNGRTDEAKEEFISCAAKRPIIMPHESYVTMLIVRHYHENLAHQLTGATIAAVRGKFWIPKLRTLVLSVRRACQHCRIRAVQPRPPIQGQLPMDRIDAYARPFTNTGLDFFGPYHVTIGRRRDKRWVALFTCMAVRAVHLEVAADLSTDACLNSIRNLCHIRGVPSMIRCDNGTNLVGAKNELERTDKFFNADAVQRELSTKGVVWKFNCPGNPEAGGAWERLVQCVKRVLDITLHEEAPRVETFRALLLEAANVVNSRPMTHVPANPEEPDPLTPNHFLVGGPNVATLADPRDVDPKVVVRQWMVCRGLARRFWAQFVRYYLPELTRRSHHYTDEAPLRVGDVVFVCDDQQHRSRWTRGVITEVAKAKDGVVRTATVETAHGVYRRPVTRLARLEVGPSGGVDGRGAVSLTG